MFNDEKKSGKFEIQVPGLMEWALMLHGHVIIMLAIYHGAVILILKLNISAKVYKQEVNP